MRANQNTSLWNLAYISNQTRCSSLLTRINVSKNTCEIDDRNRIKEQYICSHAFHRTTGGSVRKVTVEEQFKPRILETFDPVTQKLYRHLPVTIHTEIHTKIKALEQAELLFLSIARELGTVA
jgi:hypothetical protein